MKKAKSPKNFWTKLSEAIKIILSKLKEVEFC